MPNGSQSAAVAAERSSGLLASARRRAGLGGAEGLGDLLFRLLCTLVALLAIAVLIAIVYELVQGARPAMSRFGLGFLVHEIWEPNFEKLGALTYIYGTVVTCFVTMLLAVPLGVSIALFLSTVASGRVRSVIGPLVEMLAAIPSVILGFWGLVVFAPFLRDHVEPFLHEALGFLPFFGTPSTTGQGLFTASLILTIMVVPIVAAISRDLFLTVPQEMRDGAIALGATRWEVVRGVILPSTASGVVAASFLGLGRALGEAIAVLQVIGGGNSIKASWFEPGETLASKIAIEILGAPFKLQKSSLFYLGVILLVLGLLSNLAARAIMNRFDVHVQAAR
jgi:phosphate transport system permease protein